MDGILTSLQTAYNLFFPLSEDLPMKETLPFGASELKMHLGLDVEAPEVPEKIQQALEKPCPFWPNQRIKETHLLCLIPQDVTLGALKNIAIAKLHNSSVTESNSPFLNSATGTAKHPYWILITKKNIPNTQNLCFDKQKEIASKHNYEIPTLLEAAVAVLAAKFLDNATIYGKQGEFTRCDEQFNRAPVAIGSDAFTVFSVCVNEFIMSNGVSGVIRG